MMSRKVFALALTMVAALALVGVGCGDDSGLSCPVGSMPCGARCVDPLTDELACGNCTTSCRAGESCHNGICQVDCTPAAESCDNRDNDCDTQTDETVTRDCNNTCGPGIETCTAGSWGTSCTAPTPGTEVCDSRDNDCDGSTDEGVGTTYYRDSDADLYGDPARTQVACGTAPTGYVTDHTDCNDADRNIRPGNPELCTNTVDDDCDGTTNEDCPCSPIGSNENCGEGGNTGECEWGTRTCQSTGWGTCTGGTRPATETCDRLDNDCDGTTDNGIPEGAGEINDTCATAWTLPRADEGIVPATFIGAMLYSSDGSADMDWYIIQANEASHLECLLNPLGQQCYFYLDISLTPPAGADHAPWRLCVYDTDCAALGDGFCTTEADWVAADGAYVMSLEWSGTCGLDDGWTFHVKVDATATSAASCTPYALDYVFDFSGGIGSTYCT